MDIHGTCDDRFAAVKTVFEENFSERGDIGACVAVTYQGEYVVDLWGAPGRSKEPTLGGTPL